MHISPWLCKLQVLTLVLCNLAAPEVVPANAQSVYDPHQHYCPYLEQVGHPAVLSSCRLVLARRLLLQLALLLLLLLLKGNDGGPHSPRCIMQHICVKQPADH